MDSNILREKFLDFFKARKHKIVESDSLVPKDDPTVLFTPAGMNQFKREFMGETSGFKRAATSQRCLRTDDLDKVGKTAYHHTFFEMLGNFSFGDYFKEEAIALAWEFLTRELKIPKDKLWVSVYKDDDEAYAIWEKKIGILKNRIVRLGDKENFWPAEAKTKGPNGPCGPCSEIFFDFGEDKGCGEKICDPSCSCGRFVEVWNLVFTQFNRKDNGILEPLPHKNIDTGMGLERLSAVMQGVYSNFQTDLFIPIINEIRRIAKKPLPDITCFIIADHIRAVVFAVYDGIMPSNDGRGYVIRKLIRKSLFAFWELGLAQPYLHKLVPVVAETMKSFYPELVLRRENIAEVILSEEKNYINTLNASEALFKEKLEIKDLDAQKAGVIAFQLYDTYGIPWELTVKWAGERGIKVSQEAFNHELESQKKRSKLESKMSGDVFGGKHISLGVKPTLFQGYKKYSSQAKVLKILKDGQEVKKAVKGEEVVVILDKTSFYAESGGQVGDTGKLIKGKNVFTVLDAQRFGKVITHKGKVSEGGFKKNDLVLSEVDLGRRLDIARNHTATHLLQAALRKILGAHVKQQGSLVAQDRLRFDFTHFKALTSEQLDRTQQLVNEYILGNYKLGTKEMTLLQAKKKGALAFFQEKYENKVRVVSVSDISQELCGGTHLEFTGQIGIFKILQESSIASGIRRIEATTGRFAYEKFKKEEQELRGISIMLNVPEDLAAQELEKKLSRIKELEKQLDTQRFSLAKNHLDTLIENAVTVNNTKVISGEIENAKMDLLRKSIDIIKEKTDNAVIVLGSSAEGKAILVVGVTSDLCQRGLDASKLIPEIAKVIGGSGGGRKDFAQAGGVNPDNLEAAFKKAQELVANLK